jgi:hypothetical protein
MNFSAAEDVNQSDMTNNDFPAKVQVYKAGDQFNCRMRHRKSPTMLKTLEEGGTESCLEKVLKPCGVPEPRLSLFLVLRLRAL